MEPSAYIAAVESGSAALAAAGRTDLDAAIPSCPGWQVRDVIAHVAWTQGWSAAQVTARSAQRADGPVVPEGLDGEALGAWAEERTAELVNTLTKADPDGTAWTFGLPRTARFWFRRQAHEVAVHRWDAQSALGTPDPLPGELAADGIDEYLDIMLPRMIKRSGELWGGETVHLHRTDGQGEWLVTLGPGETCRVERTHGKGALAIRASASDLLLWTLNRRGIDSLETFGDTDIAGRWATALTF